jgi:hypothetical protein
MRVIPFILLGLTLFSGCAKYNYDITQPPSSQLHITPDAWQRVSIGPVSYHFRTMESHLIIQVYNTTDGPLRILGDRSYIITPAKQSIPLESQSIAPGTFVKFILPPLEQVIHPGPSIGFGFGYSTGRVYRPEYNDPFPEPRYLYVDNPGTYWEWDGETNATFHLAFEQSPNHPFDQTFIFHRIKA